MTHLEPFGFVRRCGWETDENGREAFRVIVEYPNGPPDGLSWSIVWDTVPVSIVVINIDKDKDLPTAADVRGILKT